MGSQTLNFPQGLMLPCRARIWAALVESEDLRKEVVRQTQRGGGVGGRDVETPGVEDEEVMLNQ